MMTRKQFSWLAAIGSVCIATGVAIAGVTLWRTFGTDAPATAMQDELVAAFEADAATIQRPAVELPSSLTSLGVAESELAREEPIPSVDFRYGEVFGVIRIPRFGDDYAKPLLEDTDSPTLQKGVGHYVGAASPCQVGNFAIAGHRTTYGAPFRQIDQLEEGDEIVIETERLICTYAVERHLIVKPTDWEVVAPVPGEPGVTPTEAYLTMTSCHPLYSAAQRYIVHARLVGMVER